MNQLKAFAYLLEQSPFTCKRVIRYKAAKMR